MCRGRGRAAGVDSTGMAHTDGSASLVETKSVAPIIDAQIEASQGTEVHHDVVAAAVG